MCLPEFCFYFVLMLSFIHSLSIGYGDIANGNHNWVEVYDPSVGHWKFLEPSPALDNVDNLDKNPCSRWFCQSSRYPSSKVYAAKLSKRGCPHDDEEDPSYYFPLAWEWGCEDVPAVDRTQYYSDICGLCPHNEEEKQ